MTIKDLEVQVDRLVFQAQDAVNKAQTLPHTAFRNIETEVFGAFRAAALSFIESTFGRDHSYYSEFDQSIKSESDGPRAIGIVKAIQAQIRNGWLETTRGLVSAEVFGDFLEMAEHLLEQNYKDPAAVLTGGVLEEHLRQLCASGSVPTHDSSGKPRKADGLNAELTKAGTYTTLDQKNVTSWLDLRNKAAHGKYSEYTKEHVELMLAGVRNFVSRIRP